jgi:hypothetical protein
VGGEPREIEERRSPLAERHRRLGLVEGRQLPEPVHAGRALTERALGDARGDARQVVADGEHLAALLAHRQEALGVVSGAADRALDVTDEAHR